LNACDALATLRRVTGKIQRALISVSDKTGIVEFAKDLQQLGIEIISTGGTARVLRETGVPVTEISKYTDFPEIMDGRLKTLHPKVHGGLLFVRGNPEHEAAAAAHGIKPIDLVVVNLYPFEQTPSIENIDIGGSAMLRSAAKNYTGVTVIVDPADYPAMLRDLHEHDGNTCAMFRWKLAIKAFETTARYDIAIAQYLHAERMKAKGDSAATLPAELNIFLSKAQDLRYGENPHQRAAFYGRPFEQLHGKELSYNNILDLSAAAGLVAEFDEPTVAIIKHTNPCGVGSAPTLRDAWNLAYATDRQAAFGGVIAMNRPLDVPIATAIVDIFSEVIVAPEFLPEALLILEQKKSLRLIRRSPITDHQSLTFRSVMGGILAQDPDTRLVSADEMKVVTKREPSQAERHALLFGWRVVKHVKSNAVVFATESRTLGIGAGQMSRIDSVKLGVWKAREAELSLAGSAIASDAFFPFKDGIIAAADAGATAVIQPGGSVRDAEVIAAADERNLSMIFTGIRHFKH
jgi:phosphoribosylaminoimidazolecarboxamide formyltransferase/IMP cyclohydrolase